MFDVVWSGRRHVMMGASQLDPYGNQNFAFIGDPAQPEGAAARHARRARQHDAERHQLLDPRITRRRCSCEQVDVVSGIGYDRAAELGDWVREHHELRHVVTNLGVLDFGGPDHRMRLHQRAPRRDRRRGGRGHRLRARRRRRRARDARPDAEELEVIELLDPTGLRDAGGARPDATDPRLHTRFCDLVGVEYPIVQTGMGWVVGRGPHRRRPRRPAASASSPAPPWTSPQLRRAIARGEAAHRATRSA